MNRVVLVLGLVFLAGCGKPVAYLNPEADLGFYQTVAVTPLWTEGGSREASSLFTDALVTSLMISEKYEVVEPGHFRHILDDLVDQAASTNRGLTPEQVKEVGDKAGVQAIFEGTILAYEMTRIGQNQYPLISVELRLLDVSTGRLVWTMTLTKKGGPGFPFFGFGQTHTLPELADKVADELVAKVP